MKQRIVKAMPLISLTLFLGSGLFWEDWLLGLSFFLLVPISWMIYSKHPMRRFNDLVIPITLLVYIWLGAGFGWWGYAWVVFFLIPLSGWFVERKLSPRRIVSASVVALFVTLGFLTEEWNKVWIVLLLIPIVNTIFFPVERRIGWPASESFRQNIRRVIIDEDEDDQL